MKKLKNIITPFLHLEINSIISIVFLVGINVSILFAQQNTLENKNEPVMTRWKDPVYKFPPKHEVLKIQTPLKITIHEAQNYLKQSNEISSYIPRICILVHTNVYADITPSLVQYQSDLTLEGYSVLIRIYSGGSAEEIKTYFIDLYEETESLSGVILVGDIPYVIYEIMSEGNYSDFPCDLFYMDINGIWDDIVEDSPVHSNNGKYDSWEGNRDLEIWVCRMKTDNLTELGSESNILNKYFNKNHRYRDGTLITEKSALGYIDDDWAVWADHAEDRLNWLYGNNVTIVSDPEITTASDYVNNRLTTPFEFMLIQSHGSSWSHGFYQDDHSSFQSVYRSDYFNNDPQAVFYSFFICSVADYTMDNFLAGSVIFNTDDSGLFGWGSTKPGGMHTDSVFYNALSNGEIFGEAFKNWFNAVKDINDAAVWFYGMVMIGDASLRIIEPLVSVISPNGGEWWEEGTDHDILWEANVYIPNVKIEYSTNGGLDWNTITSSTNNYGSYTWKVSGNPSNNCLIKISDALDGNPSDKSDSEFNIIQFGELKWHHKSSGTSNNLQALSFTDRNKGWSVGQYGSILYTADGGDNWYQQSSGTKNMLRSVYFLNENAGWTVGYNGEIIKTNNGGLDWYKIISHTYFYLRSVYFVDSSLGWAVGYSGTILKTTDGGDSWISINNPTDENLNGILFLGEMGCVVGSGGTILISSDGGDNWINKVTETNEELYSVYFIDGNTGWVAGNGGLIMKTLDSGNSWLLQNSNINSRLKSIYFSDYESGWAVGDNGVILKSVNGGEDWRNEPSPTKNILNSVYFTEEYVGWIAGDNGTILKYSLLPSVPLLLSPSNGILEQLTTILLNWSKSNNEENYQIQISTDSLFESTFIDTINEESSIEIHSLTNSTTFYWRVRATNSYGVSDWSDIWTFTTIETSNWVIQSSATDRNLSSLYFTEKDSGWAVGNGTVIFTTDGGSTWLKKEGEWSSYLTSIFFSSPNTGWIAGEQLYKTSDAGQSWLLNFLGRDMDIFTSVHFTDINRGWSVMSGTIYYTSNGGDTWDYIYSSGSLNSVFFIDSTKGWIVGQSWVSTGNKGIIYVSSDGGLNWTTQLDDIDFGLLSVVFINENTGWTVGENGIILSTTDSGDTWISQISGITSTLNDVYFIDIDNGWAVGDSGIILSTTDRGENWNIDPSPTNKNLNSVFFVDMLTGWIAGDNGTILKYEKEPLTPVVKIALLTKDGLGESTELNIGIDPQASDSLDYIFGETPLPPMPTEGTFETRLKLPNSLIYSYSDYRQGNPSKIVTCIHEIKYQLGDGSDGLTLSWNLPEYTFLNFKDPFNGVLFDTTFGGGEGSYKISHQALTNLYATITYNDTITSVDDKFILPTKYCLFQNYPNPFNPSTIIKYQIPDQVRNDKLFVILKIFDILGKEIATLVNEQQKPGDYKVEWNAVNRPSGIYFYQLTAGDFVETKKMILLR